MPARPQAKIQDEPDEIPAQSLHTTPPARTKGGVGTLLSWLGMFSAFVGVVLCAAPKVSWKLGQISEGFKYLGIEGGTLVMGGLVLFALGMLRRAQIADREEEADDRLLVEQVAADLLQVRDSLEEVNGGTSQLAKEMRALQGQVAEVAQVQAAQPQQQPQQSGVGEEAIFRLAASLDQLGARMEQRLKSQYGAMQDSLEELNGVVLAVRKNMQEMLEAAASEQHAWAQQQAPAPAHPEQAAYMEAEPAPMIHMQDAPPVEGTPLGLLDSLDDPMTEPRPVTPPPQQLARTGFQPMAQAGTASLAQTGIAPLARTGMTPRAAVPAPRPQAAREEDSWAELVQLDPPAEHQAETQQKLDQLNSLLADDRLRAALDKMRKSNG